MVGILLLHGYAGSRDEVCSLGKALEQRGYRVSMPRLAGHEAGRRELARCTYRDWIQSADDAYCQLAKTCSRIVIIGFSMGGLIAVQLCQKRPIAGLVTINSPVYYWNVRQIAANLRTDVKTYARHYVAASVDKPFRSLLQFQRLLSKTKPLFQWVTCPALVVQTRDDDTVRPKSADYIYSRLKGPKQYGMCSTTAADILYCNALTPSR